MTVHLAAHQHGCMDPAPVLYMMRIHGRLPELAKLLVDDEPLDRTTVHSWEVIEFVQAVRATGYLFSAAFEPEQVGPLENWRRNS